MKQIADGDEGFPKGAILLERCASLRRWSASRRTRMTQRNSPRYASEHIVAGPFTAEVLEAHFDLEGKAKALKDSASNENQLAGELAGVAHPSSSSLAMKFGSVTVSNTADNDMLSVI